MSPAVKGPASEKKETSGVPFLNVGEKGGLLYPCLVQNFLIRWFANTLGIGAAVSLTGIHAEGWLPILGAGALYTLVKDGLRPVLLLLSLPIILLTLGLFILVINALLLWGVIKLVPGFNQPGFLSILWGSLISSFVGMIVLLLLRRYDAPYSVNKSVNISVNKSVNNSEPKSVKGRVIDV